VDVRRTFHADAVAQLRLAHARRSGYLDDSRLPEGRVPVLSNTLTVNFEAFSSAAAFLPASRARGCPRQVPANQSGFSGAIRKRKALLITETELRLIASAPIMGDNSQPVNGNSTPAASGTPSRL
jgi:hypothetical protein